MLAEKTFTMLVDREQVSFDGLDCNRIGTSFGAFNTAQGSRCQNPQGTCLQNQLKHLRDDDYQRYLNNKPLQYLTSRLGYTVQDGQLAYESSTVHKSVVRIEIAADNLKVHKAVANGIIDNIIVT